MQEKQPLWAEEWSRYKDDNEGLFRDWIHPWTLEDFRGKRVLDAGCGHGAHTAMTARFAKEVVGVDLNCADIARREVAAFPNASVVEGDIARVGFERPFDVVYCVGVIHHTDDPAATFRHLAGLVRPGGRLIVWAYSHEGNFLNRTLVEGVKRWGLLKLPAGALHALAWLLTFLLYPVVYSVYLLPLRFLPYYEYFGNFRRLSLRKNVQNVFDKLIAPQTWFLKREEVAAWFADGFGDVHLSPYMGVSWRASGTKRA
ncbi:MAG: methyltransferase domain-containing protein [Elusimicrobia bacterium]|nr:methyltransferase domain-containing protein [Elusimicrobiota bacterium]